MHAVVHLVGGEGALDLLHDHFARWDFCERQGTRGVKEAIEMLIQLEDSPVIKPQSLPDRITSLHRRVERTNAGFVAMNELAVEVDQQVAVSLIKLLQHRDALTPPVSTQPMLVKLFIHFHALVVNRSQPLGHLIHPCGVGPEGG